MILSNKYKEELNKIVMDEEMRKRILNNVLRENSQNKRKKCHLRKIHMQIAAACFLVVICFSVAKNFMQQNRSLPKQISQNAYDKNNYNEENNSNVQEHQNLEQHSNADINSLKNKYQENNKDSNNSHNSKYSYKENVKEGTQEQAITNNNGKDDIDGSTAVSEENPIKEYKTIEEAEEAVKFKINTIKVLPDKFNIDNIYVISEEIIQIEYNNGKDTINFRAGKNVEDISGDYSKYEFEKNLKLNNKDIKVKGHTEEKVNLALWQIGDISYAISAPNGIEEERISEMIKDSF